MKRHKTIESLIAKAKTEIERNAEAAERNAHPSSAYKGMNKGGEEVWGVEYIDGTWSLWHYGTKLGHTDEVWVHDDPTGQTNAGHWVKTFHESIYIQDNGPSVSDQQGMNGFCKALGISHSTSRQGRTADYGGLR